MDGGGKKKPVLSRRYQTVEKKKKKKSRGRQVRERKRRNGGGMVRWRTEEERDNRSLRTLIDAVNLPSRQGKKTGSLHLEEQCSGLINGSDVVNGTPSKKQARVTRGNAPNSTNDAPRPT